MIVINLFGGPGVGKSTISAGLFYLLKIDHINAEYIQEYAKDLTFEKRYHALENQAYVFGKQLQRMHRVKDSVDVVINDSPLILSTLYQPEVYYENFRPLVLEVFNSFTNINFLINRTVPYTEVGRNQTYDEALKVDAKLKSLLDENNVQYININGDKFTSSAIKQYLLDNNYIK